MRWGMLCAAGERIDFRERGAVLARDTWYAGIRLPEGSAFHHDIDYHDLVVVLTAQPTTAFGHPLPLGCRMTFWLDSRLRLFRLLGPPEPWPVVCSVRRRQPWALANGMLVELPWGARLRANGQLSIVLQRSEVVAGVCYPALTRVTLDVSGQVIAWQGAQQPRAPSGGPYRNPATR